MTFKEGDIATTYWSNGDLYSMAVAIVKNVNSEDSDINTEEYASLCVEASDVENLNELLFDVPSVNLKWVRHATTNERNLMIFALKASQEPKAKEYLERFFGIKQKAGEFQPYDKVLVRNGLDRLWEARFFDMMCNGSYGCTDGLVYVLCIPYNEQTKYLHGTDKDWEE